MPKISTEQHTHPPKRTDEQHGVLHRRSVPIGISGFRSILPTGERSPQAQQPEMDHGTILSENVGDETENNREKGSQEVQSHLDRRWKIPQRTPSHCSTRRKEAAHRQMGRHSSQEKISSNPQRPTTNHLGRTFRTGKTPSSRYL